MALNLEVYNIKKSKWIKVGCINPGDLPGSMSDNKSGGTRDVYIFECLSDNSKSIIYRSKSGTDTENERLRKITTSELETIKELRKGEYYEMKIMTDRSLEARLIRFLHD